MKSLARAVVSSLVVALAVTACADDGAREDSVGARPTTQATESAAPTPTPPSVVPEIPVRPATEQAAPAPPPPVSLAIADLGISMPVDPVGVEPDASMSLPETGERAGWYRFGPAPGSTEGTVVVAAHVDTRATGLGEFAKLVDIRPGAQIVLVDAAGTGFTYTVSTAERIAKTEVPIDRVFDRSGERRLVLVTCGGSFDRGTGHYVDNVIVTALPTA